MAIWIYSGHQQSHSNSVHLHNSKLAAGICSFVHTILGKEAKEGIRTRTSTLTSVIGNSWNIRRTRGDSTSATHATMDNNSALLRSKKRITSVSNLASASRENADFIQPHSSVAEWPLSRTSSADCCTVSGFDVYPGTESVPMEELILWSQSYPAQVRDKACLGNDEPLVEVHQIWILAEHAQLRCCITS